jgi:hypothetical protein
MRGPFNEKDALTLSFQDLRETKEGPERVVHLEERDRQVLQVLLVPMEQMPFVCQQRHVVRDPVDPVEAQDRLVYLALKGPAEELVTRGLLDPRGPLDHLDWMECKYPPPPSHQ